MGTPQPLYPLTGHCSVVYEDTLYVYSPAGFQSLKLEEGAEWQRLPMDISLTGAECVKAVPKGNSKDAKLFIVGGRPNATATNWNYPGLMHYSFSDKKWDWQRSESWNTQNRVNHGAVYLQDSQKILVYSGSQLEGNTGASSETFLYSTNAPYYVSSLQSLGAPPSVMPMLMNTDPNTALLVGGGPTNTAVWKFTQEGGWQDVGVKLAQPLANPDQVKCTVVSSKDGEVALQKFDMSVTPNAVERILLLNKDGKPASSGTIVGGKSKRVVLDDFSSYNETYAPMSTRSGYSLAQGDDGTTVASGGNAKDPIALFDARKNAWMNATAVFGGQQVLTNSVSSSISSSSPTSTASSSATASSTDSATAAPPPPPPDNKGRMLTVLGATLGTIFGIAFLLVLVLLCLKYRKNKSKKNAGYVEKEARDARMSFADRGADFMKEAGGSVVNYQPTHNNDSLTSLAIIQGKNTGHTKNVASDASTAGLVKKSSPLGYSEPYELAKFDLKPEPAEQIVRQNSSRVAKPAPRARSSGWSRYFANNDATNLASAPPADRSTFASDRTSMDSVSRYTNSRMYSSRPSQHIAPLEIPKFGENQRLSSVASGSPTLGAPPTNIGLPHNIQPMKAELSRANSNASTISDFSHNGYLRQPVESWTPVGEDRRTSSQYTGSMVIEPNSKYDATSSYYPDPNESFYPKSNLSSFYPGQENAPVLPDMRDSTYTMFPAGHAEATEASKGEFSAMYPTPPQLNLPQERESIATLFPSGQGTALPSPKFGSFYPAPRAGHESNVTMFPGGHNQDNTKKEQTDMSWLNIGESGR
ncbi:pre-mrna splicing factor clf1 [Pyrenophora seminiperda CCB06]|uniref:Pre-mrna splicing factor clf1 n=1 Tax=Pyrenophora seminiperda CCB06 TaxID=1302712 RepID=A0A3M7M3Z4_9PLEO|nr:pre-mrna splicing factor clf1 [Pyrenophora seminiperda CCB06]